MSELKHILDKDPRLTDSRTPLAHSHKATDISDIADVAKTGSFTDLKKRPYTLSGYGITDAYTKEETKVAVADKIATMCAGLDPNKSSISDIIKALKGIS